MAAVIAEEAHSLAMRKARASYYGAMARGLQILNQAT
jgi:hypothetical protein